MLQFLKAIGSGLVSPITGAYGKYQDTKLAKEEIKGKLSMAKISGQQQIELTDKQWELLSKSQEPETWKDEYSLITATAPIWLIILGVFWFAFTGDVTLLDATKDSLGMIKTELGIDMGLLAKVGIFTGLGIKTIKGLVR